MKKFAALFLVVMLTICSLAACADKPASNDSGKNEESKKDVKLTFSIWGDDARKKLFEEQIIKKFTEKNPHIQVEILLIPQSEYQQKLSIMLASKTAPDVAWFSERMVPQFIQSKQLLDISSLKTDSSFNFNDFIPSAFDIYKENDALYGIPFIVAPSVLFYNKTMFTEKGLKTPMELYKEGKWTYEEFVKTAKVLTDSAKGTYGARLMYNDWKLWLVGLEDTLSAYGATLFNKDGTQFLMNSPEGEKVFQLYSDMMFKDQSHVKPGDQLLFETGKIGMARNQYSSVGNYRNIKGFEWDIAPMPKGPKADSPIIISTSGYTVTKDTAHPKEALELVKYMTSPEVMGTLSKIFIPSRKSVLESDVFLKADKVPSEEGIRIGLIEQMKNSRLQTFPKNWQKIDVTLQTTLDELYTQRSSVKEVLSKMDKEVTPLLK